MQTDLSRPLQEIADDLRKLAEPFDAKLWGPLMAYISGTETLIKGRRCTPTQTEKLLSFHTAKVRNMEIVVDRLLGTRVESARVELEVRVAAVGRRIDNGKPDGVIVDGKLVFIPRDGRWHLSELSVDCPPEWAQWNSRPNSQAPIHYGDLAWWEHRLTK
jgi:hypothetical protein